MAPWALPLSKASLEASSNLCYVKAAFSGLAAHSLYGERAPPTLRP